MFLPTFCVIVLLSWKAVAAQQLVFENDMNFRIEAGGKTCFFESGKAGQTMEAQYQVIDGQHGDLDISFQIVSPTGEKLLNDYKKSQNSVIMDLDVDGDYVFCMDNTFSVINSKLVFVYVLIEDKVVADEAPVKVIENGEEQVETLEWVGSDDDGEPYYIEVKQISDSLTRTLRSVVKARQILNVYSATRSRDSYSAFKDTYIVDLWSGIQISCMCIVGVVQVFMIKKLFNNNSVTGYYY